jgi:hypothetical protein
MILNIFKSGAGMPLRLLILGSDNAIRKNKTKGAISMATPIHQEVDFKASPKRVYEALIDAKQFSTLAACRN